MNISRANFKCLSDQVLHSLSVNVKDKIKTHESPGFCFKFFILSRKRQTKPKLVLTRKFFGQMYTHFGPAVKKVKAESRPDLRSVLCSCMGFASLNVPP